MLRNGLLAIGIVALVISGAGAAGPKTGGQSPLFGDDGLSFWTVTDFTNGAKVPDAIFHFEGQSLSLDILCYRRSWAYRYEADVMRFTNPHGSESRCNGETPQIVESFDSTIPKVKVPEVNGDGLSLLDADGRPLFVLKRLTATGLENRKWQISSFSMGDRLCQPTGDLRDPLSRKSRSCMAACLGRPVAGHSSETIRYVDSGRR